MPQGSGQQTKQDWERGKPAPSFRVRDPCDGEPTLTLHHEGVVTRDALCLPHAVMQQADAAAQTFGALLRITGDGKRSAFPRLSKIGEVACLPERTVRRHLDALERLGFVGKIGREKLPGGQKLRRTATYYIDRKKLAGYKSPFAILPRWAADAGTTWSVRAVFALLASRHSLCEWIEEHGTADNRFAYSLTELCEQSGLGRDAVIRAKAALERSGVIEVSPGRSMDRHTADYISLRSDFLVPVGLLPPSFHGPAPSTNGRADDEPWLQLETALTRCDVAKVCDVVSHCRKLGLTEKQAFMLGKYFQQQDHQKMRGGLLYTAYMSLNGTTFKRVLSRAESVVRF